MCANKNSELLPYYERARELLNYDSVTGVFTKFVKKRNAYEEVGAVSNNGYRQISITINGKGRLLLGHRLAWFIYYSELPNMIDHKDGNKTNNSISNIRPCTNQENSFNTGKRIDNKSGFKGVTWYKINKKWIASIKHNRKKIHLGCFDCPKEASKVYENKAKELFGEFYKIRGEVR